MGFASLFLWDFPQTPDYTAALQSLNNFLICTT
jgi:hypothetical protein